MNIESLLTRHTREYVSNETGEIIGAIVYDRGEHVVLSVIHGPTLDIASMVACRSFPTRKGARRRAAHILNMGKPVNIAPVM